MLKSPTLIIITAKLRLDVDAKLADLVDVEDLEWALDLYLRAFQFCEDFVLLEFRKGYVVLGDCEGEVRCACHTYLDLLYAQGLVAGEVL